MTGKMPEETGLEVAAQLREAVEEIRKLVVVVAKTNENYENMELRRARDRRLTYWVGAFTALAVVVAIGGLAMWVRVTRLIDDFNEERRLGRISNCQYTNSQNERTRQKFIIQYDKLEVALPSAIEIINDLRNAQPTARDEDRDCNSDRLLTVDDYQGDTVPADLPIEATLSIDDTSPPTTQE